MHPWAWWAWALGVAAAASLTRSPLLLAFIAWAITAVVLTRRTDAPWARSLGAYFVLAGVIIAIRLFFQVLVGAGVGSTVVLRLPEIALPEWAAGIRLGGGVTAEGLAYAFYDALRLAVVLLCLGAANSLANPRRALRSVPAALYEASVAVVIALSVAPQLIESTRRVRRARRLRGGAGRGWGAVTAVVIPVLADAIERSLALAAGMEARGFGRTRDQRPPSMPLTVALLGAMGATVFGLFLVLGGADAALPGLGLLAVGIVATVVALRASGRRLSVSRYRPQPWTPRDTALAAAGLACFLVAAAVGTGWWPRAFEAFNPSFDPLAWPTLHPAMAPVVLLTAAPLALTPMPTPGRPAPEGR